MITYCLHSICLGSYLATPGGARQAGWPSQPVASFLRVVAAEKPVKSCDHGGFRPPPRGYLLVLLPAAPERLVKIDERLGGALLCGGVFIFKAELLTLGIHDIEEIGQAAIVALLCQGHRPLARQHRIGKTLETALLRVEIRDRRIRFLHGIAHRFPELNQALVRL